MSEAFYVGAYWGARSESADSCASRLSHFLLELADVDPLLASWFRTGGSRKSALKRPVDPDVAHLRELILSGQSRRDDPSKSVISELGFSADMWNGQDAQVGLRVRCGSSAAVPGMTSNVLVMQLPAPDGVASRLYRHDSAVALMRTVVMTWQPSWSTWTSHRLRNLQTSESGDVVAGWATYVADPKQLDVDCLAGNVISHRLDTGILLVADGDASSIADATVLSMRKAFTI